MGSRNTLMSDIMEEMDQRVLDFIKKHITTFTRWDVIKFCYENPNTLDTAENLARYVGRTTSVIQQEAEEMAAEGIFRSSSEGGETVYSLNDDVHIRKLVAGLVEGARDRTFRMKLVYHILRAGSQE
jgi:hypothetical protein